MNIEFYPALPFRPEFDYSIDEWVGHFDHFFRLWGKNTKEGILQHFASQYPHSIPERRWKMNRFRTAMRYLLKHQSDFEELVVTHENLAVVTLPVVQGLWRYYTSVPDDYLGIEPKPELILQLAREVTSGLN